MNIEDRLENMERELGHLKRRNCLLLGAILFVAGVLVVPTMFEITAPRARAQVPGTAKEIRANQFLLVDENGETRGGLFMSKDGPSLSVGDVNGRPGACLYVSKGCPQLVLQDENGNTRTSLGVFKDGPSLTVFNENGDPGATLGVAGNSQGLIVGNKYGKVRATLLTTKSGPQLMLYDEYDTARVATGVTEGVPFLAIYKENGKVLWVPKK